MKEPVAPEHKVRGNVKLAAGPGKWDHRKRSLLVGAQRTYDSGADQPMPQQTARNCCAQSTSGLYNDSVPL